MRIVRAHLLQQIHARHLSFITKWPDEQWTLSTLHGQVPIAAGHRALGFINEYTGGAKRAHSLPISLECACHALPLVCPHWPFLSTFALDVSALVSISRDMSTICACIVTIL